VSEPLLPLPVYPWPLTAERSMLLRRAKAELDLPFLIQPVEAVPGSPGRVIAFGGLPPFLCEVAMIRPENVDSYESVLAALRAVLTAPEGAAGFFDEGAYLSALVPGTREITDPVELQAHFDMEEYREIERAARAA
jgi:hypothetical protein